MMVMVEGCEEGRGRGRNISAERAEAETDFSWAARAGDVILINTNPSTLPSLSLSRCLFFSLLLPLSLSCSHVYPWRRGAEDSSVTRGTHRHLSCAHTHLARAPDERKLERLFWRAKRSVTRNLVTTFTPQ